MLYQLSYGIFPLFINDLYDLHIDLFYFEDHLNSILYILLFFKCSWHLLRSKMFSFLRDRIIFCSLTISFFNSASIDLLIFVDFLITKEINILKPLLQFYIIRASSHSTWSGVAAPRCLCIYSAKYMIYHHLCWIKPTSKRKDAYFF